MFFFKYYNFLAETLGWAIKATSGAAYDFTLDLVLPVGISFYTFQILSYVVDVYRGDARVQTNVVDLLLYISFFPQLIAGPIVRYVDVEKQLQKRTHSFAMFADGIRLFSVGLAKKVLIADSLGYLCGAGQIFRESADKSVVFYWLYAISFTLHIYFDFSGYSDMAPAIDDIRIFLSAQCFELLIVRIMLIDPHVMANACGIVSICSIGYGALHDPGIILGIVQGSHILDGVRVRIDKLQSGKIDHLLQLGAAHCHRLFTDHMLAGLHQPDADVFM